MARGVPAGRVRTAHGDVKIEGQKAAFGDFLGLLDKFDFWFNIVTP